MGQIQFEPKKDQLRSGAWHAVCTGGKMKCSCGRPLVKLEPGVWACSYGYPVYRMDEDELKIDKFGNLYIRKKKHK